MSKNQFIRSITAVALLAASASVLSAPVGPSAESEGEPGAPAFTLQTETEIAAASDAAPTLSVFAPAVKPSAPQRPDRQALASESQADTQAALSLTLWSFVRVIQAQQEGSAFEMLQTSLALQEFQVSAEPDLTPVPLPGAVWLFVMGLLGLAGGRFTRAGGAGPETAEAKPPHPMRGAVPA